MCRDRTRGHCHSQVAVGRQCQRDDAAATFAEHRVPWTTQASHRWWEASNSTAEWCLKALGYVPVENVRKRLLLDVMLEGLDQNEQNPLLSIGRLFGTQPIVDPKRPSLARLRQLFGQEQRYKVEKEQLRSLLRWFAKHMRRAAQVICTTADSAWEPSTRVYVRSCEVVFGRGDRGKRWNECYGNFPRPGKRAGHWLVTTQLYSINTTRSGLRSHCHDILLSGTH
jgi:hypothetical protein